MGLHAVVALFLIIAAPDRLPELTPDSALLGKWKMEKMVFHGDTLFDAAVPQKRGSVVLIFKSMTYKMMQGETLIAEFSYKVDSSVTPRRLICEYIGDDVNKKQALSRPFHCIYQIRDGKMERCQETNGNAPKDFSSTAENKQVLSVLSKMKD